VKNVVEKVSVQKCNHVYICLSWDEIRSEKLLSLYPAGKKFEGLAGRVVRDLVLTANTLQFTVTEGSQCSEEMFLLLYSVLPGTAAGVHAASAPPPYPSEGILFV